MKKNRLISLLFLTFSLVTTGCNPYQSIIHGSTVDTYDHAYDDMEISSLSSQYMSRTYKDYAKYNYYGSAYCPSTGNPKLIIVPVWFTDSDDYITNKENVRSDIEKAYLGTASDTGWESVTTYYQKDSFGKVTISGTVLPWYECGNASTYYYTDKNTSKTIALVNSAYTYAESYISSYNDYDTDGDGYIDGIMLIYGSPDNSALEHALDTPPDADNMWAYAYWTRNSKNMTKPTAKAFFWASYDFMYSQGLKAFNRTGKSYCGSGDTSHCSIDTHTFIHEMGHVFGLDDYYDYSSYKKSPALAFSMQDHNVGGHDPFSRLALGWAKAYIPTQTSKFKLKPIESSGEVILLENTNSTSAFNEYLLLEFYSPEGLNKFDCDHDYGHYEAGPKSYGIRVWHVDARLASFSGWRTVITDDPSAGQVVMATNNTTYENVSNNRAVNYAGSYEYNELQVIRRDYNITDSNGNVIPNTSFRSNEYLSNKDLFIQDDFFTTHKYRQQFVNKDKMNNSLVLGWSFYVDEINTTTKETTITVIKK